MNTRHASDRLRSLALDIKDYVQKQRNSHKKIPYGTMADHLQDRTKDLVKLVAMFADICYIRPVKGRTCNNVEEACRTDFLY